MNDEIPRGFSIVLRLDLLERSWSPIVLLLVPFFPSILSGRQTAPPSPPPSSPSDSGHGTHGAFFFVVLEASTLNKATTDQPPSLPL
jgi:hypothetical protein